MRLSDIMSAMQLSTYAEIALVLFLAAFAAIVFYVFGPSRRSHFEAVARIPLGDDDATEGASNPPRDSGAVQ